MEENAFLGGALAGILYIIAGTLLIRLSWRTQRPPELLLGLSFLLWGTSYACWQIPIATADEPLTQPLFFAGHVLTYAGSIVIAYFTWIEFRSQSHWAKYLFFAIVTGLFSGVAGSIAAGDWEGIRPLSNPWWWLDWTASMVAVGWVGVEGFISYTKSRQRVRLELCDPLACNRYLLWGIVGTAWAAYSWLLLYQTIEFETDQVWSTAMERATSLVEIAGIALVLLIFFPPHLYQRWISGTAPDAKTAEG